jgi:30S ribosomal protein 3
MERFVLKFLWMEKSLGICLDQKIGHKLSPLTEYYFWPKNDAWDEIRINLEVKSWITQSELFSILNQITEVINDWQELSEKSNCSKGLNDVKKKFSDCLFIGHD